ncbi:putative glycosyltransferase YkoT [Paenibacillus cisolokensis]|jgi:Glycosyltransferases involved in cell wall biogenesis|uniref:Glycosyltransferase YkoT n=1 Tax=Paenibacillus cisolokensis TaxID=1658519 RepID=A0ABQ4N8Q2_9BACL|nr:glycosyltransferase family 2 protein [Paenibacillus cisolokensis]GIQ64550.1 putative glycosyltransferase YkoT [Paenibacillus cisolokensis]
MDLRSGPRLAIVSPCYNEEEVLPETIMRLSGLLTELMDEKLVAPDSFLLFVDDGSSDRTWPLIVESRRHNPLVHGLKLARNAGHQQALVAGLMSVRDRIDCAVTIDADLQDDPAIIREFVKKYKEGCDIVYGVRRSRATDTFFKRTTAIGFYRLMEWMGVNIVFNHADFRLMSKRAIDSLERFKEVNLFLRGIVPSIGFRSASVYYDRTERFAGTSKYPLRKMIAFALDGITSFSIRPIRLVTLAGFIVFLASLTAAVYALISKFTGNAVSGWTSLIVSIWLLGGIQLLALGLIGEYIGKIYKETKRRPLYIVETLLLPEGQEAAAPETMRLTERMRG